MCGFIGVAGLQDVAPMVATGLAAIQHRGQDACGIGTVEQGRVHLHKDLGLVSTVFGGSSGERLASLRGRAGIGHVRYPTVGAGLRADAQPFHTRRPGVLMAHNGNVTNLDELGRWLGERGVRVQSGCDVEPIMLVFAESLAALRHEPITDDDVCSAVAEVFLRVRGAYTCVALLEVNGVETLVAFRDPHGIRPGCYGSLPDGSWIAASESVALDALGAQRVADLPPGAVVFLTAGALPRVRPVESRAVRSCVFERIYFARPDSLMEGGRVYEQRWKMGVALGEEWRARGLEADVVVPVPDTSRPAAQALAETLGLPLREGFIKNRYSGRTFIMPDAATRQATLRLKLNPIPEIFEGKRVILVDDSVVRGTTVRRLSDMVRTIQPAEVHLAVFSPPVRHPCFYGIDMPSRNELVAARLGPEQWPAAFGCDTVTFLSVEGLRKVAGPDTCRACFDGDYVVPLVAEEQSRIVEDRARIATRV